MGRVVVLMKRVLLIAVALLEPCHSSTYGGHDDYFHEPQGLRLPTFVASHMVLQREPLASRIWGWATPGANVSVDLNLKLNSTNSDDGNQVLNYHVIASDMDGSWTVEFPPQPAGDGHSIVVSENAQPKTNIHSEENSDHRIILEDIAFGDVYLCSGQSNMEMTVSLAFNASLEIEDSIHYPNLRLATVQLTQADTPQVDVQSKTSYIWARSSPEAVPVDGQWGVYSATCYFFGRELYKSLEGKVPIGLLTSCWGGQTVESFSSPDAIADNSCGGTRPVGITEGEQRRIMMKKDTLWTSPDAYSTDMSMDFGDTLPPTVLWNGMIHPLIPMRFTGAIWYQGEANAHDPANYACRFPAMITDWRVKMELPNLSFFYVELAGYLPGKTWPWLRAAQAAALQLPQVGVATAVDLADPDSPAGEIHPRRKQEVGRRLSLSIRAIQYKERNGLVYSGPTVSGVQFYKDPSSHTIVMLGFVPGTADGLHFHGAAACTKCCDEPSFEVLDAQSNWVRVALADVQESDQVLLITTVDKVFGIRYAWEPQPECVLYNGIDGPDDHAGLPMSPFLWCANPMGQGNWDEHRCQVSRIM